MPAERVFSTPSDLEVVVVGVEDELDVSTGNIVLCDVVEFESITVADVEVKFARVTVPPPILVHSAT
jgi:hypothetical protein